jgi:P-type conjugative transfer ATPase TrbB
MSEGPSDLRQLTESQTRRHASLRTAVAPIIKFLDDDTVVEIMLNADGQIWVEKTGAGMFVTGATMSREDALRMLRLVATEMNTELSDRNPSLAGKLPVWGARVQASIPPIVEAPVFALQKPPKVVFTLDDYVRREILTEPQSQLLKAAVRARKNILIGGGTGSGKTTLANALLDEITKTGDRLYLVEDNPELQCRARNKVQVLVQPPMYTWQRAILDAMRFRPDRIIVGEVRDGSALEMLKAWNTGHPGGLATCHANDTAGMLDRLCQLIEEVVPVAPRVLVAQSVHICIHISRDPSHPAGRSTTGLASVLGVDRAGSWQVMPLSSSSP